MSIKFLLIWTVVTVAISAVIFGTEKPEPEVRYETRTVTETITLPAPKAPPTEVVVPSECLDAATIGQAQGKAALDVDRAASTLLDHISEARLAVAMGDSNALNDIETALRQLNGTTLGAVEKLTYGNRDLPDLIEACEAQR